MATEKYHISDKGRPNICRAGKKPCPVGGNHYSSKEAAREGYEKAQKKEELAAPLKKKSKAEKAADTLDTAALVEAGNEAVALEDDLVEEYELPEDVSENFEDEVEEVSIDDDFSDIKCDDCKHPLSECTCGHCEYCGVEDPEVPDDHEEDCPHFKPKIKAYSWE